MSKTMAYALVRLDKLCVYTTDGKFLIDNNSIESCIRSIEVGMKNYMFAGCHEAAQQSGMLYNLMETCKLNNINPYVWLQDVLCGTPSHSKRMSGTSASSKLEAKNGSSFNRTT